MKFLALYRSSVSAQEMMAAGTPEEAQEGLKAWAAWILRVGDAIVDPGAPLGNETTVPAGSGSGNGASHVTGYSVVEADSIDAARALFDAHPHLSSPGNPSIELLEALPVPGM
jgi:hypothetical protein